MDNWVITHKGNTTVDIEDFQEEFAEYCESVSVKVADATDETKHDFIQDMIENNEIEFDEDDEWEIKKSK